MSITLNPLSARQPVRPLSIWVLIGVMLITIEASVAAECPITSAWCQARAQEKAAESGEGISIFGMEILQGFSSSSDNPCIKAAISGRSPSWVTFTNTCKPPIFVHWGDEVAQKKVLENGMSWDVWVGDNFDSIMELNHISKTTASKLGRERKQRQIKTTARTAQETAKANQKNESKAAAPQTCSMTSTWCQARAQERSVASKKSNGAKNDEGSWWSRNSDTIFTILDVAGGAALTYYETKKVGDLVEKRSKEGYQETAEAIGLEHINKLTALGGGVASLTKRLKSGIDKTHGVAAKMSSTDGRGLPACPVAASGWHSKEARRLVSRFAGNWFGPGYLIGESDRFCGGNANACITNCSLGGKKARVMLLTSMGTSLSSLEFTQVVLHEIGHAVLGHLDIGTGHNHRKEIEAQQWSAARMKDLGIPWSQAEPIFRGSMDYSHIGGVITVSDNLAAARRGYSE